MISEAREQELLRMTDMQVLFAAIQKELGISENERISMRLLPERLARHLLALSAQSYSASNDVIEDIGLRESLLREKARKGLR